MSTALSAGKIYRYSRPGQLIPVLLSLEIALFGFLFFLYPPDPFREEAISSDPVFVYFKLVIFVVAILFAFWIYRFSFEVRSSYQVGENALIVRKGAVAQSVDFKLIESIDYENMLGPGRKLFGFMVVRVKNTGTFRIYNVLKDGGMFVEELVRRVCAEPFRRDDLKAWINVLGIDGKMGRARLYARFWYYPMGFALLLFIIRGYII
jgi:hypothetical protein